MRFRSVSTRPSTTARRTPLRSTGTAGVASAAAAVAVIGSLPWSWWAQPRRVAGSSSVTLRWPVRFRKTSSRLGSRSAIDDGGTPAWSRSRSATMTCEGPLSTGSSRVRPSRTTPSGHSAARTDAARSVWSGSVKVRSSTVSPRRDFSSDGVPSAITAPRSTTTIRSARRSASSRYWVVEQHGRALADQLLDQRPHVVAAARVEAGGGLVEEQHRWAGAPAPRRCRAGDACRPSRSWPAGRRRAVRANRSSSSSAVREASRRVRCTSWPIMRRFSRPVRFSSTAAYCPASPMTPRTASASRDDVVAAHLRRARVGHQRGGQDPHGGRLARAVRAEQAEDRARWRPPGRGRRGPAPPSRRS